jgi:hypothetical protein
MKNKKSGPGRSNAPAEVLQSEQPPESQRRVEMLTGIILFAFGVYNSVLYFGHTVVPISDFASFFQVGKELLSLRMPTSFKYAPVVGILQNLLVTVSGGSISDLTAGWLLNAILHPFSVVLLWLVGKRIIGRSAAWFALIAAINPWTIYSLTEPIGETTYLFFILLTVYLLFRRSRWAYLAASITTMVRYEGAALIMAAFVMDIIYRKDRRDVIRAFAYSFLASLPLVIWLVLTAVTWQGGTTHYFDVLFGKEYSKGFAEPVEGRRGVGLHLQLLWQTGFQPLLIPYPGASEDFVNTILKLGKASAVIGFVLGCIFAIFKRRLVSAEALKGPQKEQGRRAVAGWEVLVLLLFFVPYFALHAWYPYPIMRFHSTIFWIAILVAWFGLRSAGGLLARKIPIPGLVIILLEAAVIVATLAWVITLIPHFSKAASISPTSATMPYIAMLTVAIIIVIRMSTEHRPLIGRVPRHLCAALVMCLVIASNQFMLSPLLGDGKREIEFKMLGEWFAATAGPNDKLAVYQNDTQLFAGKFAQNVIGFPKASSPRELVEKLRQMGVTYVVWATREGFSHGEYPGYQLLGLNKNIGFLDKPRSIGPYEFVRQVGTNRGYVSIFRLKDKGDEQLPNGGN